MAVSLMVIQETIESLLESLKAEPGGGATDKSWVQSCAGCICPGPVTNQWGDQGCRHRNWNLIYCA